MLHQVAACVVRDQGMCHPFFRKFPGSKFSALEPGPGFIDPDMDIDTLPVGGIDGCGGGTVVHKGEPSGVAVGEDVYRLTVFLCGDFFDNLKAVLPEPPAELRVFVCYFTGYGKGFFSLCLESCFRCERGKLPLNRPGKVRGCRAGGDQLFRRLL